MENFDLIVRGAEVWTPGGFITADIGVREGKIAALGISAVLAQSSKAAIDAKGKVVIPGLIDTHTHHREPGFTHKEDITTATQAAAAGGVTLSVGMPNVDPPTTTVERYRNVIELSKKKALVDFNHNPSGTVPEEISKLAEAGCLAFKIFMVRDTGRDYPHMPGIGLHNHGALFRCFEEVAKTGLPLMVHPHDQDLMDVIEQKYWQRGDRSPQAYAKAYRDFDGIIWDSAIATIVRFQKATGVKLDILHMSTPGGLEMARRAKEEGRPVSVEVNPWALFLGSWENVEKLGPYCLGFWVPERHVEALWKGIEDGTVDLIGTDHAPHTKEEKDIGWKDMWKSPGGEPQIQDYLKLFLTAVNEGKLSLDKLVRITSYNPARIFGVYPRKGTIQIGSDADLTIVDMKREETITNETTYTRVGWTPYHGRKVKGAPVYTIVRGKVVMQDGRVVGKPGGGELITPVGR
ncbi:MAG: dihydroorotase family protein [Deltaproteobacteria bacterium]|nr:dihydroorotase family protein [Deltaproteobacteria bacterium]